MSDASPSGRPQYFPALDGLRLVAFTCVLVGHGFVGHPWNHVLHELSGTGVDVFFALSGFLITTLLLREHESTGRIRLTTFWIRRALRIFPIYYLAVVLGIGLLILFGDRFARPFGTQMANVDLPLLASTHALFVSNWFDVAAPTSMDVLWSISVEEQFYLAFPLTLAFARRRFPVLLPVALGLLLAWAARGLLATTDPSAIYRNTIAHADHLLLGALLGQVLHVGRAPALDALRRLGTAGEVALVAALAALVTWAAGRELGVMGWLLRYFVSACICTALVALVAADAGMVSRVLRSGHARRLGQLTYAAYVFHMYALGAAWFITGRVVQDVAIAAPLRTALAFPLTFLIAWLVRVAFEARVLAWKARFSAPSERKAR